MSSARYSCLILTNIGLFHESSINYLQHRISYKRFQRCSNCFMRAHERMGDSNTHSTGMRADMKSGNISVSYRFLHMHIQYLERIHHDKFSVV
jgi:hypothetical protein